MDFLFNDFDILSESSSSEDQDDVESLYGTHAHYVFSSLEESIKKIDDFLLFERGFMHGETVGLVSDPLGQMGKVVNVDMVMDLESPDGSKLQNVNSRNLQKIRSISVGDCVVCGAWLGKVKNVVDNVTILFDDGTNSQLTTIGVEKIVPVSPELIEDPQYPFYPGQRVQVELSSVSKSPSWLYCRKNKREHGTVCTVDAGLVYVEWIDCALCNCKNEPVPQSLQDLKNLSLLPCFPHANWQLGDWCVLPMEHILPTATDSGLVNESKKSETIIQKIAVIMKTKIKVDIQWQDGSQSISVDSHLLFPVNIIDVHDFWPHAFVLENGMVDSQVLGLRRWGVVKFVDSKERTVVVKWSEPSLDPWNSKEKEMEEIVSAYELVEHPDYSYRLGDAVFRATMCAVNLGRGSYAKNHTILKTCVGEEADLKDIENSGHRSNVDNYFLSNIGIVVGLKQGHVKVQWASGSINEVAPYEILRVGSSSLDPENLHQSNEELLVEESQLLGQNVKDVSGCNEEAKHSKSHFLSQAALGFVTSITLTLFGSIVSPLLGAYRSILEDEQIVGRFPEDEVLELCHSNLGGQLSIIDDLETPEKDILFPSSSTLPESFRQLIWSMIAQTITFSTCLMLACNLLRWKEVG